MDEIEQVAPVEKRRGRPVGAKDSVPRMTKGELMARVQRMQAIGALQGTSARVLYALNDADYWLRVIGELEAQGDYDKIAQVLQFHQQMRDGRPHQQINVTATNIQVSAEQIARARQVVRELMLPPKTIAPQVITGEVVTDESTGTPNAFGGQGVKKDGGG